MIRCLFFILFIFSYSVRLSAQNADTYDLVHLKTGRIITGKILSYEEADGDILIIDNAGRKFSLTRNDYDYFREDLPIKKKSTMPDSLQLKLRKHNQWGYALGMGLSYTGISQQIPADNYIINSVSSLADPALIMRLSGGYYKGTNTYTGIFAESAVLSQSSANWAVGGRYVHYIDGLKKNTIFYVPVELGFKHFKFTTDYGVGDTLFTSPTDYSYPTPLQATVKVNSLFMNIGTGFRFMLGQTKSVDIELLAFSNLAANYSYTSWRPSNPKKEVPADFKSSGFRLNCIFNF